MQKIPIRVESFSGDQLIDVQYIEVDSKISSELNSFVEYGRCSSDLLQRLKAIAPRVIPLIPFDEALKNREFREFLCAGFVLGVGTPLEFAAKYAQQLK